MIGPMIRFQSLKTLQMLYGLALLALVVVAGVVGTAGLVLNEQWAAEAARIERLQQVAEEARGDLYRQTKEMFDFHFLADPQALGQYQAYASRIDEKLGLMATLADGAEETGAVERVSSAYQAARASADAIMERPSGTVTEAEKLALFDTEYEEASLTGVEVALDSADQVFLLGKRRLEQRVTGATRLALAVLLVPIGLAAALLLFARSFLQRAFVGPLSELLAAMRRFGAGDLDHRVAEHGASEMIDLQRGINRMADEVAHSRGRLIRSEKQAALGALVPVIAHNIRNPLASIRATAQLMQLPETDAESSENIRGILGAVDRLSNWLTALLSYLNPQKAHRIDATLADCADHALTLLAPRLTEKSLHLERRDWPSSESTALDTHLMEQAIYGLLANAVDASPENASLTVSVGSNAETCWLTIEDDGPGLPFEPSPQGAFPGPSTKTYGSGLGIPFAYKICELHDGELVFRPGTTSGTNATISVPRTASERGAG